MHSFKYKYTWVASIQVQSKSTSITYLLECKYNEQVFYNAAQLVYVYRVNTRNGGVVGRMSTEDDLSEIHVDILFVTSTNLAAGSRPAVVNRRAEKVVPVHE